MTMPLWQCVAWAQYRYMGLELVTGTSKVPTKPLAPLSKGMKPLWTPGWPEAPAAATGWQGEDWVDWVTVWLRAANWNWMTSPGLAVTLLGVKAREGPPTSTGMRRVPAAVVLMLAADA